MEATPRVLDFTLELSNPISQFPCHGGVKVGFDWNTPNKLPVAISGSADGLVRFL